MIDIVRRNRPFIHDNAAVVEACVWLAARRRAHRRAGGGHRSTSPRRSAAPSRAVRAATAGAQYVAAVFRQADGCLDQTAVAGCGQVIPVRHRGPCLRAADRALTCAAPASRVHRRRACRARASGQPRPRLHAHARRHRDRVARDGRTFEWLQRGGTGIFRRSIATSSAEGGGSAGPAESPSGPWRVRVRPRRKTCVSMPDGLI